MTDNRPSYQESCDRIQATDRIYSNYLKRRVIYHTERRTIKRWTNDRKRLDQGVEEASPRGSQGS